MHLWDWLEGGETMPISIPALFPNGHNFDLALLSFFLCLYLCLSLSPWNTCPVNPAIMLWESPSHLDKPQVSIPANCPSYVLHQQPASASSHVSKQAFRWFLPPSLKFSSGGASCHELGASYLIVPWPNFGHQHTPSHKEIINIIVVLNHPLLE